MSAADSFDAEQSEAPLKDAEILRKTESGKRSQWRIELARLKLWPPTPPAVERYYHGWVHVGNERMLRRLIRDRQPRVILELGAWLGLCTQFLAEESAPHGSLVLAIDRWDGRWLLQTQQAQYAADEEALGMLSSSLPLYETFLANLWALQSRVFPIRMDTKAGMHRISQLGVPVDLVYVDADHTKEATLADIHNAVTLFPDAVVCGDDWQWPDVRDAVEHYVDASGGQLRAQSHPAENWWCLERTVAARQHPDLSKPRVTPSSSSQTCRRTRVDFVVAHEEV